VFQGLTPTRGRRADRTAPEDPGHRHKPDENARYSPARPTTGAACRHAGRSAQITQIRVAAVQDQVLHGRQFADRRRQRNDLPLFLRAHLDQRPENLPPIAGGLVDERQHVQPARRGRVLALAMEADLPGGHLHVRIVEARAQVITRANIPRADRIRKPVAGSAR
jgi:hypothetical protein